MSGSSAPLTDVDHYESLSSNSYATNCDEREVLIKPERVRDGHDSAPADRYHFVYIIFYVFGMCSVLPWNMFITAQNYFNFKFEQPPENVTGNVTYPGATGVPMTTASPKSSLETMYESYFSVAAQVPNVLVQILNVSIKHKVTLKVRMFTSLSGMLVIFIFTTVLTKVDTEDWENTFFFVTLGSVLLINCFSAIFQGSVFGLGGLLPKRYTQALMAGQGLGGIVPALVSIICIATLDDDSLVGFVYFLLAVVCIIITFGAFFVLPNNTYAQYYLNKQVATTNRLDVDGTMSGSFELKKTSTPPFMLILKQLWLPGLMTLLTFAVTLGNFPGVIARVEANPSNEWSEKYFTPVFCFLLFNGLDFFGRSLSFIEKPSQKNMGILSMLVLMRLGFFPLFALCNVNPHTRQSDVVFLHNAYPIVFTVFFAITNGYLGSLCMMYGPKFVKTEHQETAGNMMALFLVLGLAVGSALSVLVMKLI